MRRVIKPLIVLIVLAILALGIASAFKKPDSGFSASAVSWLPPAATNIQWYKSYPNTAYEFDIEEREFFLWAQQHDVAKDKFVPIAPPQTRFILRARRFADRTSPELPARVSRGYFYEYSKSNGGGMTIVYDSDAHRAYYYSAPR